MVDAVLSFEGDGAHQFRILRAVKNRFGPTDEIGVFEMTGAGLREVRNPSALFLSGRDRRLARHRGLRRHGRHAAGAGGNPGAGCADRARHAAPRGGRLGSEPPSMVLAVLEAHCGVRLGQHDVYLNVAGGLRIQEPAADLAAAAALVSSLTGAPLAARDSVYFGEIGLSGRDAARGACRRRGSRKPPSSALRVPSLPAMPAEQREQANRTVQRRYDSGLAIRAVADIAASLPI